MVWTGIPKNTTFNFYILQVSGTVSMMKLNPYNHSFAYLGQFLQTRFVADSDILVGIIIKEEG